MCALKGKRGVRGKPRVLVLCAHFFTERTGHRQWLKDFLQPMAGLHVAAHIDRTTYDVELYNEMWGGPFDTRKAKYYDIVFLSGLQKDLDRMRQLSYFFRRAGVLVVAGGNVCSLFPEFVQQFFDVVCVGGVDAAALVMRDYEGGSLKKIYRSPQNNITDYRLDHGLLRSAGISFPIHMIEASRGCNFKCDFCTLPPEDATHAPYPIDMVADAIRDSIEHSPQMSIRRLRPMIWFIDNNMTNNAAHLEALCDFFANQNTIKGWGGMASQEFLANRKLIKRMVASKCTTLFTGIESLVPRFFESNTKAQNAAGISTLLDNIDYAQRCGIFVNYGYLFDARVSTVEEMKEELEPLMNSNILTYPNYITFVTPMLGTISFWESAAKDELLPNLMLRDLDAMAICYRNTKDDLSKVASFARTLFEDPRSIIDRGRLLLKTTKYLAKYNYVNPMFWYVMYLNNFRMFHIYQKSRGYHSRRTYIGGADILDHEYHDYPADISPTDKATYFEPIRFTDECGRVADWLRPYAPEVKKTRCAS